MPCTYNGAIEIIRLYLNRFEAFNPSIKTIHKKRLSFQYYNSVPTMDLETWRLFNAQNTGYNDKILRYINKYLLTRRRLT